MCDGERAAIIENDGHIDLKEADRRAFQEFVLRHQNEMPEWHALARDFMNLLIENKPEIKK